MSEGTPTQADRIESKLDRLLAIWERYEPLISKLAEFQTMSSKDKIKELMRRGTS